MSILYHFECRFGSEGQKYLAVLILWKGMKKEGCSCCWEIETMLYITTSGDLSALQLTTSTPTSTSVSVSLPSSLSLSYSLWLCSGSFSSFCFTVRFLLTPPSCIHTVYLSMFLSVCQHVFVYVCVYLSAWFLCYIEAPTPPLVLRALLPGCTCLVYQVHFSPCVCVSLKLPFSICLPPLSVCLLRVSALWLLLQPKTALMAFFLLQLKSHSLVRLPSSNTKLCPARMSNQSRSQFCFSLRLFLWACHPHLSHVITLCLCKSLSHAHIYHLYLMNAYYFSLFVVATRVFLCTSALLCLQVVLWSQS